MKCKYEIEELDAYIEGYISEDKKLEIRNHLATCKKCSMQYSVLANAKNYLASDTSVDKSFQAKVIEELDKNRYSKRKISFGLYRMIPVLKPVFAVALVCLCIVLTLWYGSQYTNLFKNNNKIVDQPVNTNQPVNTSQPVSTEKPISKNMKVFTLYFANSNADAIVAQERPIEVLDGYALEKVIFEELQKGPGNDGKNSSIPRDTRLLSVETREGICYLNLSSEFIDNSPGGTASESMLINSVVDSLTELPNIKKVQFLINGQKREVYTHVIFNEPFSRNENIIQKADSAPEVVEQRIRERGNIVLQALKDKDMDKLSTIVYPNKKVRFSPYSFVDLKSNLVFSADEIKLALKDNKKYMWGAYDGSGEPINLTFEEYLGKFIYDKDFINAKEIGYNKIIGQGNTINNNFEIYPDAKIIEYHFPGFDPQYNGMDWVSLRLVFEQKDGIWYLVGIIHDQWTI